MAPADHGIVGDTYYDRAAGRVAARPLPDSAVTAPKLWERLREARPGARTLLWFAPNSHGADVEIMAGVGRRARLSTRPEGLAARARLGEFGPYPVPESQGGEPPRLEAMAWILATAGAVDRRGTARPLAWSGYPTSGRSPGDTAPTAARRGDRS